MSTELPTYDIIFAGGGTAACVTAGRLAKADPSLKILIIEAGPHTHNLPAHVQPARYISNLIRPNTEVFSFHVGNPSDNVGGRSIIIPSGRCVGGGSSVNFMVYSRAAASDYDDWEVLYGNKGWGSKDLIPLLKKVETYQGPVLNSTHGTSGPLKVSFAKSNINLVEQYLEVAAHYDKERGVTEDNNTFFECNKHGQCARYIDAETGRRSDTPHNFIYNQEENKNLQVLDRQRIVRVLFEGDTAVAVEYVSDTAGRRSDVVPTPSVARASRMVVVSAGTFGSPAILERSGIGASEILKKNGVEQIVDLPGVGEHFLDHNLVGAIYRASEDADTMNAVFKATEEELEPYIDQWVKQGDGLLSHNGHDATIKMRPNAQELKEMGPVFENRWKSHFANALDKPVIQMALYASFTQANPSEAQKYFNMASFSCYPVSTGHLHITSGLNPYARMDFRTGFLEDPADIVTLRWSYKKGREIARRMKSYRGELVIAHPTFPDGSQAVPKVEEGPVGMDAPDIVYTPEDDLAIDAYIKRAVATTWHSMGTCAMKPRHEGGVVDERLNVYGVRNLKVADCSISPSNVGANTYNTALAIGEKAAVLIADDLGIKGVTAY